MDRINDMATRIVAAWYQLDQDKWTSDGPNFSSWTDDKYGYLHDGSNTKQDKVVVNQFIEAENDESRQVAREVAAEGIVLLKNKDSILPFDATLSTLKDKYTGPRKKRVAIVGEDAGPGKGPNYCEDRSCNQGTLAVGWGSGATEFTYLVDPLSAVNATFDSSSVDVTAFLTNKPTGKIRAALDEQDICIVFANAIAGEGYLSWKGIRADRNDLELQKHGKQLILDTAESCGGATVAVIHSVGPVILSEVADSVDAILYANLPGQESGNALVDVLFGKVDASGRLVYSIGRSLNDYGPGAPVVYYPNHIIPQADFKEGLYIDYRHFDKFDVEPQYPFGFGLSYTSFEYSSLNVTVLKPKSRLPARRTPGIQPPKYYLTVDDPASALFPISGIRRFKRYIYPYISKISQVKRGAYPYPEGYDVLQEPAQAGGGEGGNPSLFEPHVQIDLVVRNTGNRFGKDVVQVYVSLPDGVDSPVRVLRNFTKIVLEPQESELVTMTLSRKDLSYWDVVEQNWVMPEGNYTVSIGRSSRDLLLQGMY